MRRLLLAALAASAVALPALALLTRAPAGPARPVAPDAALPGASTDERIRILEATVRADPRRAGTFTLLADAFLQKLRETGDAGCYARAEAAVRRALALDPADAGATTARAALELSRHDFRAGLRDALRARALAPQAAKPFGVLVDALVELGRYDDAARALQEMADRRPDLAAYARVSYFRELHGDLAGAARALRLAISAGGAVPENDAYVRALLGALELQRGRPDAARRAFRTALASVPGYVPALAGLAQVDVARGRPAAAATRLRGVVARLPLPGYVVALGEAEQAAGRRGAAREAFALVRAEQRLLARAGVNTDVEVALFEADHGSPSRAVALARRAWRVAPSVRSADALEWALARAGHARAALPWARRALRLGSRDAPILLHAALVARAAGDRAVAARRLAAARAGRAALGPHARELLR